MESQNSISSPIGISFRTIRCPSCEMMWLAPGLMEGDTYMCRGCGVSFIVDRSAENELDASNKIIGPEES